MKRGKAPAARRCVPPPPQPKMSTTRILHWNVYEDGLADTPGALGFSDAFRKSFASLLAALGGDSFFSFNSTRDFAQLLRSLLSFLYRRSLACWIACTTCSTIPSAETCCLIIANRWATRCVTSSSLLPCQSSRCPGKDNPWGTPRTFELAASSADGAG